jgi:hypothetical protein
VATATLLGATFWEPSATPPAARAVPTYTLRSVSAPFTSHSAAPREGDRECSLSSANGWGDTSTLGAPSIA